MSHLPYVVSFLTILVMDLTWITLQKPMYGAMVSNVQGSEMVVDKGAALVAYGFVMLTFFGVVVPLVRDVSTARESFVRGATVGLAVYGVYNATNASIFKNYVPTVALLDTLWGTLLYGTVAAVFTTVAASS